MITVHRIAADHLFCRVKLNIPELINFKLFIYTESAQHETQLQFPNIGNYEDQKSAEIQQLHNE